MVVDPSVPPAMVTGHINNSPFANIKIRIKPSGSTSPSEFAFSGTPKSRPRSSGSAPIKWRTAARRFYRGTAFICGCSKKTFSSPTSSRGNDGKITLPYWNWMRDTDWDETSKSSVWHKENFGGFTDTAEGTITGDHFSLRAAGSCLASRERC